MIWLVIGAGVSLVILGLWVSGVLYLNDFSVPARRLEHFGRALIIFPHPDDETNVAGTLWQLAHHGCAVTIAVLTKGECGTPDAHLDPSLKAKRAAEMRRAGRILGAEILQKDFGDGQLKTKIPELKQYLDALLEREQPDLIITYDLAGLYGHADHIACAEVLADLLTNKYPTLSLWYVAWPKRLLAMANLPEHMAQDPGFRAKRATPNMRIFIGNGVLAQVRDTYAHKTQRPSFASSIPHHLPLWLIQSVKVYEYFERLR